MKAVKSKTMLHPKEHYANLSFNGYDWRGFLNGKHFFVKHNPERGYISIECYEEQLTNGDIEFMSLHNLSQVK